MQQSDYRKWLDNIVTGVDELESSYKRRLTAMSTEYQKDIEDILAAYKAEKKRLNDQLQELADQLEQTKHDLKESKRLYKTESVEHKITKDNLRATQYELTVLTSKFNCPPSDTKENF